MSLEAQSRQVVLTTEDLESKTGRYKLSLSRISTLPVKAISIRTVTFRNLFYNVVNDGSSRTNNTFFFTLNGVLQEIEIEEGNYSVTQLLAELKTKIDSIFLSSGIVPAPVLDDFSYNSINAKVSMTVNGGGVATPFELTGGSFPQSINKLLGNTEDVILDTLTPTPYQFNTTVNVGGEDVANLISSHLANNNAFSSNVGESFLSGRISNSLAMMPVNKEFGFLVEYRSQDLDAESIAYNIPIDCSSIDLHLADNKGRPLPLQNSSLNVEMFIWV